LPYSRNVKNSPLKSIFKLVIRAIPLKSGEGEFFTGNLIDPYDNSVTPSKT